MENLKNESTNDKLLYAMVGLVLGVVITCVCVALFFKMDKNDVKPHCPTCDYSTAENFRGISDSTAHDLANRYRSECQNILSEAIGQQGVTDARCVQFPLASLKKYIYDMESKVCGCEKYSNLGIRFYFGKYPDLNTAEAQANPDYRGLNKSYSFLHTVFLVPTYKDSEGIYKDFEPLNVNDCRMGNATPGSRMSMMNHGNLSPPPFPEASAIGRNTRAPGLNY